LVLLSIADQAHDSGACWPKSTTVAALCDRTGLGRDAVMRALGNLKAFGVLVVVLEQSGKPTVYRINLGALGKGFSYLAPASRRAETRTGRASRPVGHNDRSEPEAVGHNDRSGITTGRANLPEAVGQNDRNRSGKTTAPVGQNDRSYIKDNPSLNVSPSLSVSEIENALSAEDSEVAAQDPALFAAVVSAFERWRGAGMRMRSGVRESEYARCFIRVGINAAAVDSQVDSFVDGCEWLPPANVLAAGILAGLRKRGRPVILEDSVAEDMAEVVRDITGKASCEWAELRNKARARFGLGAVGA
jgi:hypothetical protein